MKKALRIILWIGGIILALAIIGAFLPGNAFVSRSITINAPASTVYGVLNDLKTYNSWMPWNQKDPYMQVQYAPVTEGKGAWYKWKSNHREVGEGQLTITESIPGKTVTTSLLFEGFDEPSVGGWELSAKNGVTEVTWRMDANMGHNPLNRWFGLFFDRMLGPDFENGLKQLKEKIENGTLKPAEPKLSLEEITAPAMQVLTIMDTARTMADVGPTLQQAYGEIGELVKNQQLDLTGMPLSWYYTGKEPYVLEAAIAVNRLPKTTSGRIRFRNVPPTRSVVVHYYGPYEKSYLAHDHIREWLKSSGNKAKGAPYDVYVDDPTTKQSMYEVRTDIVQPIE